MKALVTGASRGIGRATAEILARRGVRVALHYRKNESAAKVALQSLEGEGHKMFPGDLGLPGAGGELWRAVVAHFGRIDILINNAAVYRPHPPMETDVSEWRRTWDETFAVNVFGPADLCHCAANAMGRAGGGRILNISSRGAFRGEPEAPAYGASKAALNSLSQSMAAALAPKGVYVYCIAPGWVRTEMAGPSLDGPDGPGILAQSPLGRVATAEEIASVAAFCALDAPPAMTGAIIDVNGASYLRT